MSVPKCYIGFGVAAVADEGWTDEKQAVVNNREMWIIWSDPPGIFHSQEFTDWVQRMYASPCGWRFHHTSKLRKIIRMRLTKELMQWSDPL